MLVKDPNAIVDKWGRRPSDRSLGELLDGGVLMLDKPAGPTSHQVTAWAKTRHSDKVDPLTDDELKELKQLMLE